MHIFYAPDIKNNTELPEEESNHAVRVLRLGEGSEVMLIDGIGTFYKAIITRAHHKRCAVEITESYNQEQQWGGFFHIAVAPTKNIDRIEWFLEKSTEIGIDAITLLKCRYSERKDVKIDRLNKIIISATKQSLKARLPILEGMVDFKQFVKQPFDGPKYIAHCYSQDEKVLLKDLYQAGSNALILIGPEGDFSEDEVKLALENGFKPISLGLSRLRTETAALVGCHTLHVINE